MRTLAIVAGLAGMAACSRPAAPSPSEPVSSVAPTTERASWLAIAAPTAKDKYGDDVHTVQLMSGDGQRLLSTEPPILYPESAAFGGDGALWVTTEPSLFTGDASGRLWRVVQEGDRWRASDVAAAEGAVFAHGDRALHWCWASKELHPCVTGPDGSQLVHDDRGDPLGWSSDGARVFWTDDASEVHMIRSALAGGGDLMAHGQVSVADPDLALRMSADGTTLSWVEGASSFDPLGSEERSSAAAIVSRLVRDGANPTRIEIPEEIGLIACAPSPTGEVHACAAIDRAEGGDAELRFYGADRDGFPITELSDPEVVAQTLYTFAVPVAVFSPGGEVAFAATDSDGVEQVYVSGTDGGDIYQLTEEGGVPLDWAATWE